MFFGVSVDINPSCDASRIPLPGIKKKPGRHDVLTDVVARGGEPTECIADVGVKASEGLCVTRVACERFAVDRGALMRRDATLGRRLRPYLFGQKLIVRSNRRPRGNRRVVARRKVRGAY
jgi:hypothetical protein